MNSHPDREAEARLLERIPSRGDGLIITRQDLGLAERLRRDRPEVTWTVLEKGDLQDYTARRLLGRLRERTWDAVVLEDRAPEAARRIDLYRLMLLAAKASTRILLAGAWSRAVTRGHDGPSVLGSLWMEAWSSLGALGYGLWLLVTLRPRARRPIPPARTLAFLRTDFWFGLKAGGSITHLAGFLTGVRGLGISARILTSDHLPAMPTDVPQSVIPSRGYPRMLEELALVRYNAHFVRDALRTLRDDPPDVIVHRHSVFSVAGAMVARALNRPLVLEVNGSEVWVRRSWSRLHFVGLAAALERRSLAAADRIAVVSAPLRDVLVEHGVDPARIVVNPNGVAVSRFDPGFTAPELRLRLAFEPEQVVVGFSGTFLRWHGVLFLAAQVAALTKADPRLRFLFLGDGDLRPAVEQAVAADGARDACVFTGLVGHDEVPAYLAMCDILVSPHLPFEDGTATFFSPTKLFEYMAAGRAIAAARLGQIADVIIDDENGLLHEPGDAAGFQAAILRLAADPALRQRLGRSARRGAEATYTWDANARRAVGPDPVSGGS